MKLLVKRLLAGLGYRVECIRNTPPELLERETRRALEFDDVVCRRMFETNPRLTFIQVGAFDGTTQDPLRKYIATFGWRGVLIEPQPAPARRLRELYSDHEGIVVVEAAIDRAPGLRTLFSVDAAKAPAWGRALASFDREHLLKHAHLIPGIADMITEETVTCLPFAEVLHHVHPGRLDLLQIDTEGADATVLALFPFEDLRPAIVHWEVHHLSRGQRAACLQRLSRFGYRFAESGSQDMLAVLP